MTVPGEQKPAARAPDPQRRGSVDLNRRTGSVPRLHRNFVGSHNYRPAVNGQQWLQTVLHWSVHTEQYTQSVVPRILGSVAQLYWQSVSEPVSQRFGAVGCGHR